MNGFHLLSVQFLPADFGKQHKMGILSGFLRADHRYAPISNSSDRRVEILFVQACPPNRPDGADRGISVGLETLFLTPLSPAQIRANQPLGHENRCLYWGLGA
jgi:hypothetical protein